MSESRSGNFASSATSHQPEQDPPGWKDQSLGSPQHPEPGTWIFSEADMDELAFPKDRKRNNPHAGTLDDPVQMTFGGKWITDNGQW